MKFFVDTAEVADIRALTELGVVDGVTTNPSLIAKSGRKIAEVIAEICAITPGHVSAEVTATDYEGMLAEGKFLRNIAPNVAVKVPLTEAGLRTCKTLSSEGTPVNVTLCFSAAQALMAAKAGATYISPFVGRLDDLAQDGMILIEEIVTIFANYPAIKTEVLVASIRHPLHLVQAAKIGADVATLPASVIRQLIKHPLTDRGLEAFLADWQKTGQSIL
ncbi:fructose-6-phosphate aldolase [Roseomonas aerophila]|uniref:Probable transaldolase n=1 Tax=Teichococcus aerophilus TaxID=1224513 RepID=A0ABR7RL97_9PROT|nr:fructose-6-phosphate aldolase [Pseudoroseomonas aerophila]MBC9206907.1 fructose-6-phosphate aldolase [Pseudoroseomonas aerophila]